MANNIVEQIMKRTKAKSLVLIIVLLIAVLFLNIPCFASLDNIVDSNIFQIHQVENPDTMLVQYVLAQIDSLRTAETVEQFFGKLKIEKCYIFEEYPEIYVFWIEDGRVNSEYDLRDPYEMFFFNARDSTICPFECDFVRFSSFISPILKEVFTKGEDEVMELANLYIYSQEQMADYYLLRSVDDFKQLWNNQKNLAISHYSRYSKKDNSKKIENQLSELRKHFRGTYISEEETFPEKEKYYDVGISTWNYTSGDIEFWRFRISQRVFELVNHKLTMHKVGPHAGY